PPALSPSALSGAVLALALSLLPSICRAEDGYDLWLRYPPVIGQAGEAYRAAATELVPGSNSPTLQMAHAELARGLRGLLGVELPDIPEPDRNGAIV
ncbi:alpha-glucuronidase family glycosyl hydrolase, partial [Acinetobacter baumannii]